MREKRLTENNSYYDKLIRDELNFYIKQEGLKLKISDVSTLHYGILFMDCRDLKIGNTEEIDKPFLINALDAYFERMCKEDFKKIDKKGNKICFDFKEYIEKSRKTDFKKVRCLKMSFIIFRDVDKEE